MSFQKTKDGSLTYVSPIYGAAFHSRHGAILESSYVFIQQGLSQILENSPSQVRIFEMGFGSGLNVLLSILHFRTQEFDTKIFLDTIEKHPFGQDKAEKMNFCDQLASHSDCPQVFIKLHAASWGEYIEIIDGFHLKKIQGDLFEIDLPENYYHLIYYDAFAPSTQEELWSEEACQLMFNILQKNGVLTTYCAQGQFKRNLKSVGFTVEELPGPPGKREMTRAIKA